MAAGSKSVESARCIVWVEVYTLSLANSCKTHTDKGTLYSHSSPHAILYTKKVLSIEYSEVLRNVKNLEIYRYIDSVENSNCWKMILIIPHMSSSLSSHRRL